MPTSTIVLPAPPPDAHYGMEWYVKRFFDEPVGTMQVHYRTYGRLSAVFPHRLADFNLLLAFGADYNEYVLSHPQCFRQHTIPAPHNSALERLRQGLMFVQAGQQPILNPALHRRQSEFHAEITRRLLREMLATWQVGQIRDVHADLTRLSLRILGETMLSFDSDTIDVEKVGHLASRWFTLNTQATLRADVQVYRTLLALSEALEDAIAEIIDIRHHKAPGEDMLSYLLEQPLGQTALVGHVMALLIAGFERITSAMTWTLFLLSQHPTVLQKLQAEIADVALDAVHDLPYFDYVVKEGLRLFPPDVWMLRIAQDTFALEGIEQPAGTLVILSPYMTHRLPEIYDQPLRFLPERWAQTTPSMYEYMSFDANSGMLDPSATLWQTKTILAGILQQHRLMVPGGIRVDRQVTSVMKPHKGLPMRIYPARAAVATEPIQGNILDSYHV